MSKNIILYLLLLLLISGFFCEAFAREVVADSLISLELSDGSILRGTIVNEDADTVTMITSAGLKITMPKSTITSRSITRGRMVDGQFHRFDPNYTRLLFTPTGRPLGKGEGYITDYYVFFPGAAYGLTDHISVMGGISILPGTGLNEQLFFVAPRYGVAFSEIFSLSGGFLYMSIGGEASAGIAFATGTYGLQEKCFTAGIGMGYTYAENEEGKREFEFAKHPILVWGGNIRLSNSVSLVSENWIITGGNFDFETQPFSIAARFFGEHIAVDIGAIIMLEILREGFPIPWLSFVYNFGG